MYHHYHRSSIEYCFIYICVLLFPLCAIDLYRMNTRNLYLRSPLVFFSCKILLHSYALSSSLRQFVANSLCLGCLGLLCLALISVAILNWLKLTFGPTGSSAKGAQTLTPGSRSIGLVGWCLCLTKII